MSDIELGDILHINDEVTTLMNKCSKGPLTVTDFETIEKLACNFRDFTILSHISYTIRILKDTAEDKNKNNIIENRIVYLKAMIEHIIINSLKLELTEKSLESLQKYIPDSIKRDIDTEDTIEKTLAISGFKTLGR